jgi:DNA-binding GntR family transcriptional regulator
VIQEAIVRMKQECREKNRSDLWGVFDTRLLGPILHGSERPHYEDLVRQFGFRSPIDAANVLTTAKRMFRRNLTSVVAEYVEDPRDIEPELLELQAILARDP